MAPNKAKTLIEVMVCVSDANSGSELAVSSDSKAGATGAAMGFIKLVPVHLAEKTLPNLWVPY